MTLQPYYQVLNRERVIHNSVTIYSSSIISYLFDLREILENVNSVDIDSFPYIHQFNEHPYIVLGT